MGGRVLVPLRTLVEAFGAKIQWHGEISAVELLTEYVFGGQGCLE